MADLLAHAALRCAVLTLARDGDVGRLNGFGADVVDFNADVNIILQREQINIAVFSHNGQILPGRHDTPCCRPP